MTQTREEYLAELQGELEELEAKQLKQPSKYKGERIKTLRTRLGLPAPTFEFIEPTKSRLRNDS